MTRVLAALALAIRAALASTVSAAPRPRHRATCVPVAIEGVGTVWICAGSARRS